MFCPNCGSPIPDGSKFCTECGSPIAASDIAETPAAPPAAQPESPDIPEYVAETPAAPSAPAYSSPANALGYSVVGGASGGSHSAAPRPASPHVAKRPVTRRWWFWVIIGLLAAALIIVIAASVLAAKTPATVASPASAAGTNSLRPDLSVRAGVSNSGAAEMTLDGCVDSIDRELTDAGIGHAIEADEDDWVYIDIWYDGIDDLAGSAYDGDADALAEWKDTLDDLCDLSESYRAFFEESGQPQAVSFVSILDEADTDILLSIAVDGELVFDFVTGVDLYGILEE